jgi:import receptor subunit TOM70
MSSTESTSLVQRCSNFVSENKKAVIIGTAAIAIAAGGAAYYASTSRRAGFADVEKGRRKLRDKKKNGTGRSSGKRRTVKDKGGPILEERSPKVVNEEGELDAWFAAYGKYRLTFWQRT